MTPAAPAKRAKRPKKRKPRRGDVVVRLRREEAHAILCAWALLVTALYDAFVTKDPLATLTGRAARATRASLLRLPAPKGA